MKPATVANPNGNSTFLANTVSTFFYGKPNTINGPRS